MKKAPVNLIFGEGATQKPFEGVAYISDENESAEHAAMRFGKAMNVIGLDWPLAPKPQ